VHASHGLLCRDTQDQEYFRMSTEAAKPHSTPSPPPKSKPERGILIFTYPKIIFMFPTLVVALVCCIGMYASGNHPEITPLTSADKAIVPSVESKNAPKVPAAVSEDRAKDAKSKEREENFRSPANMLALLFLLTVFFNLVIIAIDFPRFTVVALGLFGTTALFFLLWLGIYFKWFTALIHILGSVYIAANGEFYGVFALILLLVYGIIWITRWLDYWEILPNEILHHHGPWSDLERYPTMNLKFDKEIPDIFEHFMFGAGRLVLRVPSEDKSIVLENVLHVSKKEVALKQLMSRLEVRVTTDKEVGMS
jgi:hypothetical protein